MKLLLDENLSRRLVPFPPREVFDVGMRQTERQVLSGTA